MSWYGILLIFSKEVHGLRHTISAMRLYYRNYFIVGQHVLTITTIVMIFVSNPITL